MEIVIVDPPGVKNFEIAPIFLEYLMTLRHLRYIMLGIYKFPVAYPSTGSCAVIITISWNLLLPS